MTCEMTIKALRRRVHILPNAPALAVACGYNRLPAALAHEKGDPRCLIIHC